jgi:hypothetical protein
MPHVKLAGDLSLKDLWAQPPAFRLSIPELECHIKFTEAFLGSSGTTCLIRFVVAEGRLTQHVQILLAEDPEGWLLKLDRTYPILRTPGLKLLLGILARWLEHRGATVSQSNIGDALAKGAFYADHPPGPGQGEPPDTPSMKDPLLES